MKRLLLAATAVVLVLTASGTSAAVNGKRPTVKETVALRADVATREAKSLLGEFVPPPGAYRVWNATGSDSGGWPMGEVVDRHRFWDVPKAFNVGAFVEAHRVLGVEARASENGPHVFSWNFSWPAKGVSRRVLTVTTIPRRTRTTLRVDAKVVWIYPRSPHEKVPAGVREITLDAPKVHLTVTDAAKVRRIIRWFDALPISPPGKSSPCGLAPWNYTIAISFRSAGGSALADAEAPPFVASMCNEIAFTIGGHRQAPLVDDLYRHAPLRHSFVVRLQRLLGVKLLAHD